MTPSQTAGMILPFMYSLCQLNFCRDMAPMMDTPSMKLTYDATIVAPKELTVYMSANETGSMDFNATHKVSTFACDIKVPSYLIAIVVGDLEVRSLNDRVWGTYTLVIMPPSFPWVPVPLPKLHAL
jgi:leukotriene-A4 hydrolase